MHTRVGHRWDATCSLDTAECVSHNFFLKESNTPECRSSSSPLVRHLPFVLLLLFILFFVALVFVAFDF